MRTCAGVILATLWLSACSQEQATRKDRQSAASVPQTRPPSTFSLHETSWTYSGEDGRTILETIDSSGNYISTAGADVVDRGTVKMIDEKACFTSAFSNAPPNCWNVPKVAVGETREYTNDHGGRLTVTRVAYVVPNGAE